MSTSTIRHCAVFDSLLVSRDIEKETKEVECTPFDLLDVPHTLSIEYSLLHYLTKRRDFANNQKTANDTIQSLNSPV